MQLHGPHYRFTFSDGLSQMGTLRRELSAIDGSVPGQFRYYLDDGALAFRFSQPMPPQIADLIDVCAAIYLADRLAPRAMRGDVRPVNERWPRCLELFIPVRCQEQWLASDVHTLIEDLASYLTDDSWTLHFVPRQAYPRPAETQLPLLSSKQRAASLVTLHSGDLDSLVGLIEAATTERISDVLAVSVVTNERMLRASKDVLGAVQPAVVADLEVLRLGIHVEHAKTDRESSQRTRSLLYLAAGVAVATLSGSNQLHLTENGPGAINLPCSSDQVGARMSRAVHPKTLMLFSELATRITEQPVSIMNSGLFRTKAELAQVLQCGEYSVATGNTVSCDRFPYFPLGKACGTCSSCLYRRVALNVMGLNHLDGDRYERRDLLAPHPSWKTLDLVPLDAQRNLVERLRRLLALPHPSAALRAEFVAIDDVMDVAASIGMAETDVANAMTRLFNAYVSDNDAFFARIDRPGWQTKGVRVSLPTPVQALGNVG